MSGPLGDFDLVLQISGGSLQEMFKAMHVAGTFRHLYTGCYEERFVTIVLGAPAIGLDSQILPDGKIRATASGRLLYHSRKASDATDVGYTGVADVNARVRLNLTAPGDPALLTDCALAIDWTETSAADITVHTTAGAASQSEIVETLLDFIATGTLWNYPLPALGFGAQSVDNGSFRFLSSGGTSAVAAGLNMGGVVKGSRGQLQSIFVSSGWAVGISASLITSQIVAALSARLGSLPASHGNGRPTLADATVCVVPNPLPFGPSCLGSARQRVFLDVLDWTFAEGKISFVGAFSEVTDSIFLPPISASFQFDGVPSLRADGTIAVTFSQPTVQLHEWYASFVNVLTGGAIANAVSSAIASALDSIKGPGSSGLIDVNAISQFASLGSTVQLPLGIAIQSAQMHDYGIVVQGSLNPGPTSRGPVAAFQALRSSAGPATLIFNAQSSWSPGGLPVSYVWDFGDGTQETSAGTSERFVTSHTYSPGTYQACLTVTDPQGAAVRTCQPVAPGILNVTRLNPSANESTWVVCVSTTPHPLSFLVVSNGIPVAGATMTLSSPGWQVSQTSGANGVVSFPPVDRAHFSIPVAGVVFGLGSLNVTLATPGFPTVNQVLLLSDCDAAAAFQNILQKVLHDAKQLPHEVLDPLGPVMAERRVWSSDPYDPVSALTLDTVLTSELLVKSVQLLHQTSDVRLSGILLGGKAEESPDALRKKLQTATKEAATLLHARATALNKRLAAKGHVAEKAAGARKKESAATLHARTRLAGRVSGRTIKNIR